MSDVLARDVELARAAAQAAAEAVMRWFGTSMDVVLKSPDQPLTEADLEADRIIKEMLLNDRPDYGWLSEENADNEERRHKEWVWIVDPIDGTRSFIAGRPEFSISIGLARGGEAMAGVICNPATNEYYWAARGAGAFMAMGGADAANARTLRLEDVRATGDRPVILASRSEIARGHFDDMRAEWDIKPLGSTAYKLVGVASGVADVFFSRGPKSEWDVCAGALIVQEAGGVATDLVGEPFTYNKRAPSVRGVVASSGGLHARLLESIAQLPALGSVPS